MLQLRVYPRVHNGRVLREAQLRARDNRRPARHDQLRARVPARLTSRAQPVARDPQVAGGADDLSVLR